MQTSFENAIRSREGDEKSSLARLPLESRGRFPALRLVVIYAFFGALWILVSDRLSFYLVPDLQLAQRLQTYKGWFFITVTSVLLWLLVKRFLSRVRVAEEVVHRLNRKLQAISNCNQTLLRAADEQSLLEEICRIVCEEAGYPTAWVAYAEQDESKSVRPVAYAGPDKGYLATLGITWADTERGGGPTGTAIRSGRTCFIQDFATDPRIAPWRETNLQRDFRSAIALPLKDEHANAFGSLTILSTQPNAFTPDEIRLLEELAGDLAFGIVTLRSGAARKRTEEALRQSEATLNRAQEIAHIGSWHLDIASNRLTWSDEVFRIFGVPLGTALSYEAFLDRVHPGDRESVHNGWSAALHGAPYDVEHRIIVGGDVKWVREQAQLEFSKEGNATSGIGTVQDITQRKRAEEERRESAERFRAIADYTYDWENWIGIDGKLLWVNPAVERITGYSVGECMVMPDFPVPIVAEADREAFARQMREAVQGSSRNDFEFRVRHKDGHLDWVAASWQPIYDSRGARLGHRSSMRDISERKKAEDAVRRGETYLAESQRLSHTGSWGFDVASNKYVYASEECLRIFELDAQQDSPAREAVSRLIHPEDWDRVNADFEKCLREKVDTPSEFRIVLPSGAVKDVHVIRHPALSDTGEVGTIVGTVIDITERKRANEALRQSEAFLAEAQRLSHTGSWALDVASNEYAYYSEELFRISGFDPQQGLPARTPVFQRIHPEDRDWMERGFQKSLREKVDTSQEYRLMLPDGTIKHLHGIRHPVLNDAGDVVRIVGTAIDITERKRADEALRESETRFRTFVDHAGDALFVLDLDQGIIIDVNRQACESLGYAREELIGKTPLAFDMDVDETTLAFAAEEAASGRTVLFQRHWHRRKDGSLFPVEINTSSFSHGGRRFLLKLARDISDRVRAEEQREKLRQLEADLAHINRVSMMGELAASIAHEVNQPLSGVVSNGSACLRWLAGDVPNLEEAREATRRIVRDGKRAGEIIARIRALTKRTATPTERLNLNETIRQVLALIGDQAKRNCVMIRTRFADDPFPVLGDQVQLQQVVLNLVMNAIEAMSSVGEHARELVITTENVDPDQVQVTVEDSGVGLDPNTMQKIFDPFYTTKPGGMGMGLSISRSILQAHGGRLWAASKDGAGTIFHFTLPKYHEEESNAGVSAA